MACSDPDGAPSPPRHGEPGARLQFASPLPPLRPSPQSIQALLPLLELVEDTEVGLGPVAADVGGDLEHLPGAIVLAELEQDGAEVVEARSREVGLSPSWRIATSS